MSGGHYDYLSDKVLEFAKAIEVRGDAKRAAFKRLMLLAAKAAHDIEWVDSADYSPGDEHRAIERVFRFKAKKRF